MILDGVFNHASRGFFQFSDIAENHESSPWKHWFTVNSHPVRPYAEDVPPSYEAWWSLHALPKFNTDNSEVREFLMEVGEHWIARGADGWRLDVPNEISTPGFWEEFRQRVRAVNHEAYLVGELWHQAPDWMGSRFDGAMHYQLGTAIIAYSSAGRIDATLDLPNDAYDVMRPLDAGAMAATINEIVTTYGPRTNQAHLVLLDSHDTARLASILEGDRASLRLAALLLMVMPGAPCIYYGTEVGLEGGLDPDSRRSFPWDAARWDDGLRSTWPDLIRLRHATPQLRSSDIEASASHNILVVRRTSAGSVVLATVNSTEAPEDAPLDVDGDAVKLWGPDDAELADGRCRLPARSGAVWRLR